MIAPGTVNALVAWADSADAPTRTARIAQLTAERDALVAAFLSGGEAGTTVTSVSGNGKTVGLIQNATPEEKLAVLSNVLTQLGEILARPSVSYGNFSGIER